MSNRKDNYPGPIPNRWLKCPIRSDSFIGEKFIAFKTPLDKKFDHQTGDAYSFYPNMLFDLVKNIYKKKLGLWIDLTNTNRFYNRSDVENKDCQYVKLQCRGFSETPSPEQVRSFIELVDDFLANRPLDIIGVHCTHGFNRTGFLIVSYLVEKHDYDVAAAIQEFANARPPGIYKQDYINELFKRYGDEDDPLQAPHLPDWCYEEEETPDDYYPQQEYQQQPDTSNKRRNNHDDDNDDNEGHTAAKVKKRRTETIKFEATFMPGVSGVSLMTDIQVVNPLRNMIQDMCEFGGSGFPGCQPISMDRQNLRLLHMKPYKVSWKADGTRYMMLIKDQNEIYFFDRDNSCFKVENLKFFRRDLNDNLQNTLVDGEMVIDKYNGQSTARYLVYDIVCLDGTSVGRKSFSERMKLISDHIIKPRIELMRRGVIVREQEPFSVRLKDFWDVTQAKSLLSEKFARQLSHEPDGLIFQPEQEPYVCGRCDEVLKWKPSEQNSVDFQLRIVEDSGLGMLTKKRGMLFVGGLSTAFSTMKYTKEIKDMNGKIIECKFENNEWKFMRERTDKSYPNAYTTAMAVCKSIKEPVTKEMLLDFIDRHRFNVNER
ncbi:mRNA-capping enzyme [Chironomus tepperi]|uniref:mRNA-capping enzyme n=1 Tax=Chironomus tepperi TaxID=113505 RepID=UPI00391F4240